MRTGEKYSEEGLRSYKRRRFKIEGANKHKSEKKNEQNFRNTKERFHL